MHVYSSIKGKRPCAWCGRAVNMDNVIAVNGAIYCSVRCSINGAHKE